MISRHDAWTVLLIGGHSGTGKSTLARELARRRGALLIEADHIRDVLQYAIPPEQDPALHWFITTRDHPNHSAEEYASRWMEVAEAVSPALGRIAGMQLSLNEATIIEGDPIAPSLAAKPALRNEPTIGRLRALFLVEDDPQAIVRNLRLRARQSPARGWLNESDDEVLAYARASCAFGSLLEAEARRLGLPVLRPRPLATLVERAEAQLQSQLSSAAFACDWDSAEDSVYDELSEG